MISANGVVLIKKNYIAISSAGLLVASLSPPVFISYILNTY